MSVLCKKVDSIAEYTDAIRLRVDVFIIEQNCPVGWEPDKEDGTADQYIAVVTNEIVCTGRSRETAPGEFKIERIATRKDMRRKGIAGALINFILKGLHSKSPQKIWMQSQVQALSFYEGLGFIATSDEFELDGIPHVDMDYRPS